VSEVTRWNFTPEAGGAWVSSHIYDRDVAALKAERTDLLAKNKHLQELARVAMVEKASLAATVEGVKALPNEWRHRTRVTTLTYSAELDRALAQPVKREERRKGERRTGEDCGTFQCGRRKPESDRRRAGSGE